MARFLVERVVRGYQMFEPHLSIHTYEWYLGCLTAVIPNLEILRLSTRTAQMDLPCICDDFDVVLPIPAKLIKGRKRDVLKHCVALESRELFYDFSPEIYF